MGEITAVRTNSAKAKLKAGGAIQGTYVRHGDAGLAEVLGYMGFDYLLFDGEHAPIGERECENLARACELTGVTSIARVPSNMAWTIGRHLDMGIQSIQVPMVNTVAEARAAIAAAKYAPLGTRGLAAARAARYGQVQPFHYPDYVARANEESMLILQVETPAAIEALPEIVQLPDFDVVFIGPTDLSLSLGHPGDLRHPDVRAALDRIVSIVEGSDKALGVLATTVEATREWRARGARYIMSVLEAIIGPAIRTYLKDARE